MEVETTSGWAAGSKRLLRRFAGREEAMTRKECEAKAFTLVELLVVIVIIGLLLAMLTPAVSSVWQSALASKCRHNLGCIWSAYGLWRADNGFAMLADGPGWRVALAPYLENREEVFRCPTVMGGGSGAGGPGSLALSDISFRITCRTGWGEGKLWWGANEYMGTVVVQESSGCRITATR